MMPELTVLPSSQVDWTFKHWRDPPTAEGTLYAQFRLVDPREIYSEHRQEDQPGYSKVLALNTLLDEMDLDITVERDPREMRDMQDKINEEAGRQGGDAGDALVTQVGWAEAYGALTVTVEERPPTATERPRTIPSRTSTNQTAQWPDRVRNHRVRNPGTERGRERRGGQSASGYSRQQM